MMKLMGSIAGIHPADVKEIELLKAGIVPIHLKIVDGYINGNYGTHYTFAAEVEDASLYLDKKGECRISNIVMNDKRILGKLPSMSLVVTSEEGFLTVAC